MNDTPQGTAAEAAALIEADRLARLTEAGWPRPRAPFVADGETHMLPVPWIVSPPEWATMDPKRGRASLEARLCQVCGEGFTEPDEAAVIFLDGMPRDAETLEELELHARDLRAEALPRIVLKARDQAICHERCAKLATGFCPFLSRAKAGNRLFAFVGPVGALYIRNFEGRDSEVYFPGHRCRPWLMPER
jgi:hypothetical protein